MSVPPIGTTGAELYQRLEPLAYDDQNQNWALMTLCAAIGAMLQPVNDLARDTEAGPGWSQLLDVDRCPSDALPYLGQFVGVQVDPALTDAQQRAQIRGEAGMSRGSVAAIQAAAAKLLTGTQTVVVLERTPDVASFTVITFTAETADPTAVLAALTAAKPAGLILSYETVAGFVWALIEPSYATWAAVVTAFPTWTDLINDTP